MFTGPLVLCFFLQIKYLLVAINERLNTVEEKLRRDERSEMHRDENVNGIVETDSHDSESVTSTENISSKFSYASGNYKSLPILSLSNLPMQSLIFSGVRIERFIKKKMIFLRKTLIVGTH